MNRMATVELLLLRGQVMRAHDPVIRSQLQGQFDVALAALKRQGAALPPALRQAERADRAHLLYRRTR